MLTAQQKWNRYVKAINYCISQGILIIFEDTAGGNVRTIRAKWDDLFFITDGKEAIINLKPKKYKSSELFCMIVEQIGMPKGVIKEKNKKEELPDCENCGDYEYCAYHYDECTGFIPK